MYKWECRTGISVMPLAPNCGYLSQVQPDKHPPAKCTADCVQLCPGYILNIHWEPMCRPTRRKNKPILPKTWTLAWTWKEMYYVPNDIWLILRLHFLKNLLKDLYLKSKNEADCIFKSVQPPGRQFGNVVVNKNTFNTTRFWAVTRHRIWVVTFF